jgi:hypothetical protein
LHNRYFRILGHNILSLKKDKMDEKCKKNGIDEELMQEVLGRTNHLLFFDPKCTA